MGRNGVTLASVETKEQPELSCVKAMTHRGPHAQDRGYTEGTRIRTGRHGKAIGRAVGPTNSDAGSSRAHGHLKSSLGRKRWTYQILARMRAEDLFAASTATLRDIYFSFCNAAHVPLGPALLPDVVDMWGSAKDRCAAVRCGMMDARGALNKVIEMTVDEIHDMMLDDPSALFEILNRAKEAHPDLSYGEFDDHDPSYLAFIALAWKIQLSGASEDHDENHSGCENGSPPYRGFIRTSTPQAEEVFMEPADENEDVFRENANPRAKRRRIEENEAEEELTPRPYRCSQTWCGMTFASKRSANAHMSTHALAKFWCKLCRVPVGYRFEKSLQEHMKRMHGR